jgi:hypothetical protein
MKTMLLLTFSIFLLSSNWTSEALAIGADASSHGARNPTACRSVTLRSAPTQAQAAEMVRCRHEVLNQGSGELWLMENLTVSVGAPMPFAAAYNTWVMPEAEVKARVYPLRGSFTWSVCKSRHDAGIYGNPDLNCYETDVADARGVCWKTSFGDWRCLLNGSSANRRDNRRPPQVRAR